MTYILIGIVMAFYLGFAAYVSYDNSQQEKTTRRSTTTPSGRSQAGRG